MENNTKRNFIILVLTAVFLSLKFICLILLFFIVYNNFAIRKLDDVKKDFSGFVGDTTSCAYDDYDNKLYFENHTVDLEKNLYGNYCGGVSLYKDKLFTCVNYKNVNNGNNYFRIIESDIYYDNQNIIFEQDFDYKLDAECYNNIIYFGWKNSSYKSKIDIMGYNIESREYIGIVSSHEKKRVYDYVYSIRDLEQLNVSTLYKDTWVIIKKYDEQDSKVITKEKLKDNEVGNIVCEQYMWHWDKIAFVNGKIFLVCSIEASINWIESALYNIVFEYDFENETLKYRFRYTSYTNNGIELLFGYV